MSTGWTGDRIRIRRRDMGLSQAELAEFAGLSQGYVSLLERGKAGSPEALETLAGILGLEPEPLGAPDGRRDRAPPPRESVAFSGPKVPRLASPNVTVSVDVWTDPPDGGDLILTCPVGTRGLLVFALDVVGHGPAKRAVATWLAGWMRGRLAASPGVQRVTDLWRDLHGELNAIDEGAAFFLATIERWADSHDVRYEALSDGYPPPLLLVGHGSRAVDSCAPPVTGPSGRAEPRTVTHGTLRPPWRLLIASDGLLYKVGGGEEAAGLSWIRRWQTGSRRDLPLARALDGGLAIEDDASMAVIAWDGWDVDEVFDPVDRTAAPKLQTALQSLADRWPLRRRQELAQVVAEALSNVARYAPRGPARLRARLLDDQRMTLQIEDRGPGPGAIEEGVGYARIRELADHVDLSQNPDQGTLLTLEIAPRGGDR